LRSPHKARNAIPRDRSTARSWRRNGNKDGVTCFLNLDGQSAQDNRTLFGFAFLPPGTTGAVGATQFIPTVNVTIAVCDYSTGALLREPAFVHQESSAS